MASFLRNSHLARDVHKPKDRRREDLVQDRYSLRSAPQWLGPQLEDLLLAEEQISTELNSSCDNPLVDVVNNDILYGCNFQAASVAAAMEKTRLALQMMGRLLFAQMTEMADPMLSGGLPSSLAADDPSLSFTFKGVEIGMAAYMAELSYLAGPMTSHVQAAEMHNQSVNSMAFASGRLSMQAIDILTMMCACSLYAGCQALDLRALHMAFKRKATRVLASVTESHFAAIMDPADLDRLQGAIELLTSPPRGMVLRSTISAIGAVCSPRQQSPISSTISRGLPQCRQFVSGRPRAPRHLTPPVCPPLTHSASLNTPLNCWAEGQGFCTDSFGKSWACRFTRDL